VIAKMALNASIQPFKPKNAVIKTNDKDTTVEKTEDDDEIINKLGKVLSEKQFTFL